MKQHIKTWDINILPTVSSTNIKHI